MKKNIRILYVEDEKEIRENMIRPLKHLSEKLFIAVDGNEGLALYKEYNPDIVISDIKMPNMNGIEMSKEIKKINPNQHIVFTTAHSDSTFFMNAIEMQVDGYILKPIDYKLLKHKIKSIIELIRLKREFQEQQIIINEITKLQDNLLIVLDQNEYIIFSNNKFLDFFDIANLDEFAQQHQKLGGLLLEVEDNFDNKINELDWIKQIQTLEDNKRVISMVENQTPKSFLVNLKEVKETSHTIVIFTEITNIADETKRFKEKAYTDELTKVYNRAYFEEAFDKEIAFKKETQKPLSFIILDIDKFKLLNDNYGHQIGDEVLKDLAKIIKEHTRQTDIFARWGGEEFVEILPNTPISGAKRVAEHLRMLVENHTFVDDIKITCSFGVSEFTRFDSKLSVVKKADNALYRAKKNGRNRVEIED